jgi:DNA-binding Lrp family transcriptional regulator
MLRTAPMDNLDDYILGLLRDNLFGTVSSVAEEVNVSPEMEQR